MSEMSDDDLFKFQTSPGCISSDLYQEIGGNHFSIIEKWESEDDCDRDIAREYVQNFMKEMEQDNIPVDIKKFTPV